MEKRRNSKKSFCPSPLFNDGNIYLRVVNKLYIIKFHHNCTIQVCLYYPTLRPVPDPTDFVVRRFTGQPMIRQASFLLEPGDNYTGIKIKCLAVSGTWENVNYTIFCRATKSVVSATCVNNTSLFTWILCRNDDK